MTEQEKQSKSVGIILDLTAGDLSISWPDGMNAIEGLGWLTYAINQLILHIDEQRYAAVKDAALNKEDQ